VEEYTLNTMGQSHNYFYPVLQMAESGDTNPYNTFGSTNVESVSTVSGAFALNHVWSRYTFSARYAGSGFVYNQNLSQSSSAHALTLSQAINGSRSSLLLIDDASYLPESAYGYSRFGSFGNFGTGGFSPAGSSGVNGIYIPNQSILTGDSTRVSNAVIGEYNYNLSPMSSLTFTGSYGLMRFLGNDLIDSNDGIFSLGYNHQFSQRDTIAIAYIGTLYRYNQPTDNFDNHVAVVIYGHRISNLLSLRIGGGPQVNLLSGSSTTNGSTLVSWYTTASLSYQLPRTGVGIYYTHYTSAGAGVFVGAKTDNLGVNFNRRLTRIWVANLGAGYSHNTSLQATSATPTFDTWYATANLERPIGHYMNMFISYNLQQQSSNDSFCTGGGCGSFYTRNYFSLGFSWHPSMVELGGYN
jgi:hypothetical protein